MTASTNSTPDDFDFIIGSWKVSHRRLDERLVGCTAWTQFDGETTTFKVMQGYGNLEDNLLHLPDGDVRAVALRSFDTASKSWAIWWLDGRAPHSLDTPVVGSFREGVGTFYAEDQLAGRPIRVRFIWRSNPGAHPTWEQAFSPDQGASWETNWTMEFVRVAA